MEPRNLAFVFPGQGSQSVGMLAELAAAHAIVRETFEEASSALKLDLWELSQRGPEADLNQTVNTQPALLAAGVATWRAWRKEGGPEPGFLAGHSLGEYTALVCSGSIGYTDAIRLVADRGRFMQEAVPDGEGAMAAIIGLDDDAVAAACRTAAEQGGAVEAANYNAPGQIVISGQRDAVNRAVEVAKSAGARRALALAVSVPSHCSLMKGAAERLSARFASIKIRDAAIPVVQNADASARTAAAPIADALIRQLYSPVRWVNCILTLRGLGVSHLVECGPGKVLTGLNKRIDGDARTGAIGDPDGLNAMLAEARA